MLKLNILFNSSQKPPFPRLIAYGDLMKLWDVALNHGLKGMLVSLMSQY